MKFNCGESYHKWHTRRREWHRWFAWRPVRVGDNDCRWLEYVERRGTFHGAFEFSWWTFQYRAVSP